MKIVLTGGTGLVGRALGPELVRRGHEITVLTRDVDRARRQLNYPARIVRWRDDEVPPREVCGGAEAVVHLAGENIAEGRWTLERKRRLRHSRVRAAENLAKGFGEKCGVFVSASGVGIYGDRGDEDLGESSSLGTDFLAALCKDWERVAAKFPARRRVSLRFGVVLSDAGGFLEKIFAPFRLVGASRLGHGRQYLAWIHVEDLVAILVRAVEDAAMEGTYNATAPGPVTNAEMTEVVARQIGAARAPAIPAAVLKLGFGEMSTAMLGSQRAGPKRLLAENFRFKYPAFSDAIAAVYPDLAPGEFKLVREQWVPADSATVWAFFSSEKNLERITPDSLKFEVRNISTPAIEKGTLIDYRLKIHGVPAKWRTLIAEWEPERFFVDEQLKGPYARWHHRHEFAPLGTGMLLRDVVHFKLPFGALGRLTAAPLVFKDVASIFAHRAVVIDQIFCRR